MLATELSPLPVPLAGWEHPGAGENRHDELVPPSLRGHVTKVVAGSCQVQDVHVWVLPVLSGAVWVA